MIKKYVSAIAAEMGMKITTVKLSGGLAVGCRDYQMEIGSKDHVVRTIIYLSELDSLKNCCSNAFLELRMKSALERLKIKQES